MTLLASPRLHRLIDDGVITAKHENVNSASIDICIGRKIMIEKAFNQHINRVGMFDGVHPNPVDISNKESPLFDTIEMNEEGVEIFPGECFLAHSEEFFNLPNNISAQFILRSTVARCFLEHMQAGFCDAGWHGSQLTFEFKNMLNHHILLIKPGMRIGQMIFFEHEDCGEDSYAKKGNYNNQKGTTAAFSGEGHL